MTGLFNQETTKEFLSLVESVKRLYPEGSMSNGDAYQAARNFIEFVKIMLQVEHRKQKEKELLDKVVYQTKKHGKRQEEL